MAATRYQCTTCKREREILDTPTSFAMTSFCSITSGCRGKLTPIERLPTTTRESSPPVVGNLDDWEPRTALHTHEQPIRATKWRIIHPINVPVVVDVVADGVELDHDQYEVEYTTQNLITLTFATAVAGVAQLFPRNGTKRRTYDSPTEATLVQVSTNGRIVLLDATSLPDAGTATVEMSITLPSGQTYQGAQLITIDGLSRTSWNVGLVLSNDISTHRVFNLAAPTLFTEQSIGPLPDGSRLEITLIRGLPPVRGDMLIALTYDPLTASPTNRDKQRIVDVARLQSTGIVYQRGEFFVFDTTIEAIQPALRILQ